MKINNIIAILFWASALSHGQKMQPDHSSHGYSNVTSIKRAVDLFNREIGDEPGVTEDEVWKAVSFAVGLTHENNDGEFRNILLQISSTRLLPKGALIKYYKLSEEDNSYAVFLLLNLDRQPLDLVPEPGSKELIRRVPLRVDFSR